MVEFLKITYTGKEKESNAVFDTNDESAAKKAGIYNKEITYKPVVMITGDGQLIRGFEEALENMKKGESKTVEIPPEKAYGQRNPELVKLIPLKVFQQNKIEPKPGMILQMQGTLVKIQSVESGRVRADFNHELAGKTLVFDIKIEDKVEKDDEKIQSLFERSFPEIKDKIEIKKGEETEIILPKEIAGVQNYQQRKLKLIQDIKKYLKIEKLKISEKY